MPKVSVVVPVYKVEEYLQRCVDSILNQTYTEFELILVDDGSPDNCPEICDSLASDNDKIVSLHRKNGGLSAARNTGIEWALENSDSEWITFIDSDDWIHPDFLKFQLEAAGRFNTDITACELSVVSKQDEFTTYDDSIIDYWKTEDFFEYEPFDPNSACPRLFKKMLFDSIRFPVGKLHEDRFTTYKLYFQFENIAVVKAPLYFYYENNESIIHTWSLSRLDNIEACEEQLDFFSKNGFERTYDFTVKDYINLLLTALHNLKHYYPKKKDIYKKIQNKLRYTLKIHGKRFGYSIENNFNIYKYAYPIRAKIYRRLKG